MAGMMEQVERGTSDTRALRFGWPGQAWLRPLATLIFVLVLATIFSPRRTDGFIIFWDPKNLLNVLRQISVPGILAVGMTLVIISGGIDLAVGSLLAVSGTVFAHTLLDLQWPLAVALAASIGLTSLFGIASGLVITRLNLQPFIVTLATMIGSRGFARWLVRNANIDIGFGEDQVARIVGFFEQRQVVVPTFLVLAFAAMVVLNATRFGRYVRAVGGSEDAARLSGIPVAWVKVRVYMLSGLFAGIAGILHCCQTHQGSPNAGVAYELDAIAAAVIGGTVLTGGKGGIFGTLMGALALGILSNLLGLNTVDENRQWMLKAVIIVVAVWLQSVGKRRRT